MLIMNQVKEASVPDSLNTWYPSIDGGWIMTAMDALGRVIWSADVADVPALVRFLDLMPELQHVKIDRMFAERNGMAVFDLLRDREIRVFDDAKIVEIPTKTVGIARVHLAHHPWMLNCMAGCCSSGLSASEKADQVDGLKQFADVCRDAGTKSCGVTVLTSKSDEMIRREFNGRTSIEQVIEYVGMLGEFGFTDMVCSVKEIGEIRRHREFDGLELNVPGVKMPGTDNADQARSDTPANTLRLGADRLVIGRDITTGNPAANLIRIIEHLTTTS